MNFKELLKIMVEKSASDLFLKPETYPRARINGSVTAISDAAVNVKQMHEVVESLLKDEEHRKNYKLYHDVDFVHDEEGIGRFRINIFAQRGTPALVARHVHYNVKNFRELNLPEELLKTFCEEASGLVLVCGPAGSGKSTTIASMIDYINVTSEQHIVTIEDPIEFLFESKKSIINQRELGVDVLSYANALKHVTQQSPDIIYIGNIRDVDTMRAAINATELGAFVLTTFHTINAVQTLTRIINFFPPYLHDEVRLQLSNILKGVVSMRLLPRLDKTGRVPAYETMVVTPTIARLIREGDFNKVQHFIDEGELFGMQSFRKSLIKLVRDGRVSEDDARHVAFSKDEFNLEMKGIQRFDK